MKNILFLLFLPFTLFAQNNTSLFESYMKGQADLYGFNGNVLVSKNGKVIYKNLLDMLITTKRKNLMIIVFLTVAPLQRIYRNGHTAVKG